jgi:hypothetical protein
LIFTGVRNIVQLSLTVRYFWEYIMKHRLLVTYSAAAAAVSVLGGCYSYKPPPEAISGTTYSARTEKAYNDVPADCRVLTLDKAKQISLANNPNYKASRHAMAAATARFYRSLSAYLPTISATYDWNVSKYTPENLGGEGKDGSGNIRSLKSGAFRG